ncbi:MAG: hypothetical protein K6L80_08170 [Agarilytica sp.]
MIVFSQYPHVNDLISHYTSTLQRPEIVGIVNSGISSKNQAEEFSRFIWTMVEAINEDEESGIPVLDRKDNTDMLPDISYEVTKLMKNIGYYAVWEEVSKQEMG